jgi:hypothetical protein
MIGRLFLAIAVLCLFGSKAFCDDSRFVTITINNRTPEFELVPSIEVFGQAPEPFLKSGQNTFEYKFQVSNTEWFNTVNIKLLWKGDFQRGDGGPKVDLDQRILLRIRRDFPDNFSFPVFLSNSRTQSEMARLEGMKDINDQFEVYFRSWQITKYYRDTVGSLNPLSKRAAKILFFSAVALAEQPKYFVIMSEDAERFASDAFENDTLYSNRANAARSVYWFDLAQIDGYVRNGDCNTAKILLNAFQSLKDSDSAAFKLRYGGDSKVLDEKGKIVMSKCSGS